MSPRPLVLARPFAQPFGPLQGLGFALEDPWDARRQLNLLRENWIVLRNQLVGRGVEPRQDVDPELRAQVLDMHADFLRWFTGIKDSFLSDMWGGYGASLLGKSELQIYQERYDQAVQLAQQALPEGESVRVRASTRSEGDIWPLLAAGFAGAAVILGIVYYVRK